MITHTYYCSMDGVIPDGIGENARIIDLLDNNHFSFTIKNKRILWSLPGMITQEAADLLYLSLFVFAADRLSLRSISYDSWSRDIHITVPVRCIDKWVSQGGLVESMLNFLSGDRWRVDFYERDILPFEREASDHFSQQQLDIGQVDTVCMFSGGLDSFVGAIDLLGRTKSVLFVSHYGGGKGVKEYQDKLIDRITSRFNFDPEIFYQFYAAVVDGVEDTTRTRSLMFFSHAIAIASCMNRPIKILIPENGLISLNIPLTHSRLSSSSTRTTHPYYMGLLQQLTYSLGIQADMHNPYQFKTKGEMLADCSDKVFLKGCLDITMSCSHPDSGRILGERNTRHCGICLPCLVRRAAIRRAGFIDTSDYRDLKFDKTPTARINLNSYRIGMKKYSPRYAFLKIQEAGRIEKDVLQYADLYIRGMRELDAELEAIHAL